VRNGPVKENIVKGDAVDLFQFRSQSGNPHDGGRFNHDLREYRYPRSETRVFSTPGFSYGGMIGRKTPSVFCGDDARLGKHFSKYKNRGQEMPVVWLSVGTKTLSWRRPRRESS